MDSHRHQPSIQASYEQPCYRPSCAEHRDWLEVSSWSQVLPQPITLAADATTLHFVYRSLRTINRFEAFTLFSRVTLIRRLQSMSDLDHFHAREQPCSRAKSRDDPISGRRGDSRVLYSFIYRDVNVLTRLIAVAQWVMSVWNQHQRNDGKCWLSKDEICDIINFFALD